MRSIRIVVASFGALLLFVLLSCVDFRCRCTGRELRAIHTIRVLHAAEAQFRSQHGRYADIAELGPSGADLLPTNVMAREISGYTFQLRLQGAGYTLSGVPVHFGETGRRCFYSDETGVIRNNWGPQPATVESTVVH